MTQPTDEHDCLLGCGNTTDHESGVCNGCADHPDAAEEVAYWLTMPTPAEFADAA